MFDREELKELIKDEISQRKEEGYEVDAIYADFTRLKPAASEQELLTISDRLEKLTPSTTFPYKEPSDLEEIKRKRPPGRITFDLDLTKEQLLEKTYGAWLGRCAGCMLGKPIEGWVTRQKIRKYLELANAYPLTDYIPELVPHPKDFGMEGHEENVYENAVRGKITYAARDDDLDYTVINLQVIERKGLNFTANDIAETWLKRLPYTLTYTAEKAAYRNLVCGFKPPQTATYFNPYREWIGAQIRADMWGYVAPGNPELAATLAYRDASLSHVKNGIYGEMFVAAMISAAFATNDIETIISAGLHEIPNESRLANAVRNVARWAKQYSTWEETWEEIMSKYGSYSWVHTINNAAIVLLGLLYGKSDFERTVGISVMSGLDTDCNGATCGSILGAILGANTLPPKWISPFNDRLKTAVFGFYDCHISELAKRTTLVGKTLTPQK